jgi:hypothetical protein
MAPKLSILIPSRNEPYLQATIDDIFRNSEADIEVLVGLDGYGDMSIKYGNGKLLVLEVGHAVGQRRMTRELAHIAKGQYLMKVDAHCAFGPGFDRILLEEIEDDMILSPLMYPLNAEKWSIHHHKPMSNFYFDRNFVMQFAPERKENMHETMCLQGSAFMLSKELYSRLSLDDDSFGSWGSQGVELGCKAWFNGARCMTTKSTFYAHLFRETDADFPYDRGPNPGKHANEVSKQQFGTHPKLPWLVEKFSHPGDWSST